MDFQLWQARKIYNAALEQRIEYYRQTGKRLRAFAQWPYFRDLRHENPETLGQLNARSVQNILRRLDHTFETFFRQLQNGQKAGYPKFKGRNRYKSIEFTYGSACKLRTNDQGRVSLYIRYVGEVKLVYHRPIPQAARIKMVVVKHQNDKWYAYLILELPDPTPDTHHGQDVGIDIGIMSLLALSNGIAVENPRWLRNSLARLRILQRKISRRKQGSMRKRKAYKDLSRKYQRVANQRRDFWHKISRDLANSYRLIALENLPLDFMLRNKHLSFSAYDAGFGMFRVFLKYKCHEQGGIVALVNRAYTSQLCSECGQLVPKSLHIRLHSCPYCGFEIDRDVNAARNILALALYDPLGRSGQDLT